MADGFLIGGQFLGRIRSAVNAHEEEVRKEEPYRIPTRFEHERCCPERKSFRICTYSGAWSIGSTKAVAFKNQTTTPNTVIATNLFWPIPEAAEGDCSIAKDGTAWYLLVPRLFAANAATAATLTTAALEFNTLPVVALATSSTNKFSVTPRTIEAVTNVTLGSDSLSFTRKNIGVFFESTAGTVAVSVTTCSTAAA